MKKLFAAVIPLLICMLSLCGCGEMAYAGSNEISALRSAAAEYSSGRYYVTNADTDVTEQVISFFFDSDGKEHYLIEKDNDGDYSAVYSDGSSVISFHDGESTDITSSSQDYTLCTQKDRDPYATGCLFFYVNGYIGSAEETTDGGGNTLYIYTYDTDKMNKATGSSMTEFGTSYAFDKNGNFVYFRQHNISNGESYTYEITLGDVNSVTEIENPAETFEK